MSLLYLTPLKSARAFSPLNVPGISLWLDGSDLSTITLGSGSNIAQWNDKSGNGNNCSQSVGAQQPTLTLAAHNGLASVTWNASAMMALEGNVAGVTLTQSLFLVFIINNIPSGVISISPNNPGSLNSGVAVFDNTGTEVSFSRSAADGSSSSDCNADYTTGTFSQFTSISSPSAQSVYLNGVLSNTSVAPIPDSTSQTYVLGNIFTIPVYPMDGDISEIILYNNQVSSANQTLLQSYLMTKWGL